jgi:hypothetical protein
MVMRLTVESAAVDNHLGSVRLSQTDPRERIGEDMYNKTDFRLRGMTLLVAVAAIVSVKAACAQPTDEAPAKAVEAPDANAASAQATSIPPIPVMLSIPATAFTYQSQPNIVSTSGMDVPADGPGTRYAITSVVVSNHDPVAKDVQFFAVGFAVDLGGCRVPANEVARTPALRVSLQPETTVVLTFPIPYITATVAGPKVCMVAFTGGATWSMVGYKILP